MQAPTDSNKAYHLKSEHGSWRRMYLVRATLCKRIDISFTRSEGRHEKYLESTTIKRSGARRYHWSLNSVIEVESIRRRMKAAGLVEYVRSLYPRITSGSLDASALADSEHWMKEIRDELKKGLVDGKAQTTDRSHQAAIDNNMKISNDLGGLQSGVQHHRAKARLFTAGKLRDIGWLSAIEALEGRLGQHHAESDDMIRQISSRSGLLAINDEVERRKRWRVVCFGFA